MTGAERLDDIETSLASPMRTYKENATEDAPALVAALRAVLDKRDDLDRRGRALGERGRGNGSNHSIGNAGRGEGYREAVRLIDEAIESALGGAR